MESLLREKDIVSFFLKKNILISSDILSQLKTSELDEIYQSIKNKIKSEDFLFLTKDLRAVLNKAGLIDTNWLVLEKSRVLLEKGKNEKTYGQFISFLAKGEIRPKEEQKPEAEVKIITSYQEDSKKRDIQDFVQYFNARYKAIEKLLRNRQELQNITSINRILSKKDKENISLIGLVKDKQVTPNRQYQGISKQKQARAAHTGKRNCLRRGYWH